MKEGKGEGADGEDEGRGSDQEAAVTGVATLVTGAVGTIDRRGRGNRSPVIGPLANAICKSVNCPPPLVSLSSHADRLNSGVDLTTVKARFNILPARSECSALEVVTTMRGSIISTMSTIGAIDMDNDVSAEGERCRADRNDDAKIST